MPRSNNVFERSVDHVGRVSRGIAVGIRPLN
jgi:hypothetical protein